MSEVITKSVPFEKLVFDKRNPRLGGNQSTSEAETIKYFLQNDDLGTLIASILSQGFVAIGDRLIVMPDKDQYVVLEGNRRLAALKAIQNSKSYLLQKQRESADIFWKANGDNLTLQCDIVASRRDAAFKITSKHIAGIQRWNPYSKRNYYASLFYRFIQEGESPDKSLRKIADDSPEGKTKIKNQIIEKNFLDKVFFETKKTSILNDLPQLDTEVIAGRALTQLKRELNLTVDSQLNFKVDNAIQEIYDQILCELGRVAWIEKNEQGRPLIDTRSLSTVKNWNSFLSSKDGEKLGALISKYRHEAYRDTEQSSEKNTKNPDAVPPAEDLTGGKNKSDDGDSHHSDNSNKDIPSGGNGISKPPDHKYKLIVSESTVSMKPPFNLFTRDAICLYDQKNEKIPTGSSEYEKITIISEPVNAPVLVENGTILKQSSGGTYALKVYYNQESRTLNIRVQKGRSRELNTKNTIYDDAWFEEHIKKLQNRTEFEKPLEFISTISNHRSLSEPEDMVICASLFRPVLEILGRLLLGNDIQNHSDLDKIINLQKQKLSNSRALNKESLKNLSNIKQDINQLNGYLHSPSGSMTVQNLAQMYSKYRVLIEASITTLTETEELGDNE